jgi:hypothetical protein
MKEICAIKLKKCVNFFKIVKLENLFFTNICQKLTSW